MTVWGSESGSECHNGLGINGRTGHLPFLRDFLHGHYLRDGGGSLLPSSGLRPIYVRGVVTGRFRRIRITCVNVRGVQKMKPG